MSETDAVRDIVRGVPVFPEQMPSFDPASAPASPVELFLEWLRRAVQDGVASPHAVHLATADSDGLPDARVVILKEVTDDGWQVASSKDSPKGRQLSETPAAALTFFWPEAGRQIRIRGAVSTAGTEENLADFQRRHPVARALVLAGSQSTVLRRREDLDKAVEEQAHRIDQNDDEGLDRTAWTLFTVAPDTVEFWQADQERKHTRLRYTRSGEGWSRDMLWP
jgi:pyridoxamine 5'-phosphate oxidase